MNSIVIPIVRTLLVQSLRPVEAHEDEIRAALSTALARSDHDPELPETPEIVATSLVNFLIEQVRHVIDGGQTMKLELYHAEHRLHGIAGRHYSRFADALVPVLRDILGAAYPRQTASAWKDAFWGVVQAMRENTDGDDYLSIALVAEPVS